jgi:hypothetical protein
MVVYSGAKIINGERFVKKGGGFFTSQRLALHQQHVTKM